jgi:flavin-dependent dehydrogenase
MSTNGRDYDAVVVGASLAGCSAAILLGRAGARVALLERRPDPDAFKRMCSHFIQSSAVPAIERLGLLDPLERAGAARSRIRLWTRWGWMEPSPRSTLPAAVNIRREVLDPMLRQMAAETPGVDLVMGVTANEVLTDGDRISGVEVIDRQRATRRITGRLVVGADGRDSTLAELADVPHKIHPHGRFAYAAYYEGPPPEGSPDGSIWLCDPQWAAAFPTDAGLTLYGCMLTKDRLPEFRRDLEGALTSFIADLPDAPPIRESRRVGQVLGKIEMPNVKREPASRGMALVGDAALATDPLWGVGCGWAFQSAEWLADSVVPALSGEEPLDAGLRRYRHLFLRSLAGHSKMIDDYASGRRYRAVERALFATAVKDEAVGLRLEAFATRNAKPGILFKPEVMGGMLRAGARRLAPGRRSRAAAGDLEATA